ncbi:hypothetical protein W03_01790 [Nitrosomonas sp. PY1]|uniref:hypothetical protein n=1 Tax=Nitrosomonas sp. PY1 TaxID=1803906 RepID=UPI001FC7DDC7|nr:hypothetical protein [Nitrosomonas sp. PY1]GKS68175.1 hypothetical protein W03_01790 [Nitrosomonas sp. PY1]
MKQIKVAAQAALSIVALVGFSHHALAHTRLATPIVTEGVRVANDVVIGHGCGDGSYVIASSVVFPDGQDSTLKVNGAVVTDKVITDYVSNYGNLYQKVMDTGTFKQEDEKHDALSNTVGFYVKDGKVPAYYTVYLPFRASAHTFEPTSCTASVKVVIGIADICKATSVSGFSETTVNLWTPAVGSVFDGVGLHGYDSPATLTITRDLVNNPLPEGCSAEGDAVELIPSKAQMDRDMPIVVKGKQWWPKN